MADSSSKISGFLIWSKRTIVLSFYPVFSFSLLLLILIFVAIIIATFINVKKAAEKRINSASVAPL